MGHATVLIELDGARLLTDPLVRRRVGPLVRVAPPVDPAATGGIDAVLLSHLHADHTQPASLRQVARACPVLAPSGARDWLRRHGVPDVRELREGDHEQVGRLRVTATGAVHNALRYPRGPSAQPVGFVVTGSRAVYFAGDTDIFAGMRDLNGTLDLALLPVWGWGSTLGPGHLDPARAAEAAELIEPRVAIPIHWGTFALPRPFRGKAASDRPAHEFQAQVKRRAPRVEVRLLRPGGRTVIA